MLIHEEIAEKKRSIKERIEARRRDKEELELGLIDSQEFFNRESLREQEQLRTAQERLRIVQEQLRTKREQEAKELENALSTLREYVFRLVEPHLSTLLLKKKQLVRFDDYGNVDWSFFIKELRYFVERNIKPKIDIHVSEDLENWIIEVVNSLISDYENSSPAKVRNLDEVSPIDFEHECADLLNQTGWTARVTQASGDQGIDVIATYGNVKAVFQVKKYSQPVGNSAVQEIIAGKAFENAHIAAVVTNATYTASAKQLANATGVFLLHYSELPSFSEKLGLVETE